MTLAIGAVLAGRVDALEDDQRPSASPRPTAGPGGRAGAPSGASVASTRRRLVVPEGRARVHFSRRTRLPGLTRSAARRAVVSAMVGLSWTGAARSVVVRWQRTPTGDSTRWPSSTGTKPHPIFLAGRWVESPDVLVVDNPADPETPGRHHLQRDRGAVRGGGRGGGRGLRGHPHAARLRARPDPARDQRRDQGPARGARPAHRARGRQADPRRAGRGRPGRR